MTSNNNTTSMSLRKGSKVWVEDRDTAWVAGEVTGFTGKQVQVITESGKQVLTFAEKLLLRDADADYGGVDDMTKLAYLNEPGVLDNLKKRYALNEIYTYTGSILIAVNPFTKLPHLYNVHMMEQYKGAPFGELSPHVFAVADASYRAMMGDAKSQSILVSGESGAGKTETTKLIMQYLTYVGGRAASDDRTVEQQVLESNPLLEAFGNARTVRNDNSRSFVKQRLYPRVEVPPQQVTVMDHPDFQDGFGKVWNTSMLSNIVEKKVCDNAIDIIITFDNYGVSGHSNHRDVHHGVRKFMLDASQQEIEAWELVSTNIVRKYSGPVDIWLSLWSAQTGEMHCLLNEHPRRSYAAMSQHLSQWVWFRKLFVSFSSYTYVNTLRKINK